MPRKGVRNATPTQCRKTGSLGSSEGRGQAYDKQLLIFLRWGLASLPRLGGSNFRSILSDDLVVKSEPATQRKEWVNVRIDPNPDRRWDRCAGSAFSSLRFFALPVAAVYDRRVLTRAEQNYLVVGEHLYGAPATAKTAGGA